MEVIGLPTRDLSYLCQVQFYMNEWWREVVYGKRLSTSPTFKSHASTLSTGMDG